MERSSQEMKRRAIRNEAEINFNTCNMLFSEDVDDVVVVDDDEDCEVLRPNIALS